MRLRSFYQCCVILYTSHEHSNPNTMTTFYVPREISTTDEVSHWEISSFLSGQEYALIVVTEKSDRSY